MSFQENVKSWVLIDNSLKMNLEKNKALREEKHNLEKNIINEATENNLANATISINDGRLKFLNQKTLPPLSIKFIEECLTEIIPDCEQVTSIVEYIKSRREPKINSIIKRYYN